MNNGDRFFKYGMGLVVIFLLIIFAQYFIVNANRGIIDYRVKSEDDMMNDYRVYYSNNENEYIESGKKYDASLVDYIDIDFNYMVAYSEEVDITSTYEINARIIGEDTKTKDLVWDNYIKDFVREKEVKTTKSDYGLIKESIRVDFNEFHDFYVYLKEQNEYTEDGYIDVLLKVNNIAKYKDLDKMESSNTIELKIPLDKEQFEIEKIEETKEEMYEYKANDSKRIGYLITGGILWIIVFALGTVLSLTYRKDAGDKEDYDSKLNKILEKYDEIIVKVDKAPLLRNLNVVEVLEFEELVKAQSEVGIPIEYKEDTRRHVAKFVLIKDDLAWMYILKEGEKK